MPVELSSAEYAGENWDALIVTTKGDEKSEDEFEAYVPPDEKVHRD